ncbi:MAG: hypothetical protein C7B46_13795, partial [Sulfobacillus benefaciens]
SRRSSGRRTAGQDSLWKIYRDVSAKFNRVMHQFNYRALLTAVERQATREGVALRKVKPAYTSLIGRVKYQPTMASVSIMRRRWSLAAGAASKVGGRTSPKTCGSGCKRRVSGMTRPIVKPTGAHGIAPNGPSLPP